MAHRPKNESPPPFPDTTRHDKNNYHFPMSPTSIRVNPPPVKEKE